MNEKVTGEVILASLMRGALKLDMLALSGKARICAEVFRLGLKFTIVPSCLCPQRRRQRHTARRARRTAARSP
jgi:hypothetical protein